MVPPGLAMVRISPKGLEGQRPAKMPRFYWDFGQGQEAIWKKGQTPWTPCISVFFALDVSLDMMLKEGLNNIFARHTKLADMTREGVKALGLSLFPADEKYASNTVTAVKCFGEDEVQAATDTERRV